MKKSKRIIGLFLAILMIASVFQTGLVSFAAENTTNGLTTSEAQRITDPGVTVEATPVTRVAASVGNPQAVGTTIVAATPSGIPADEGSYAVRALAGETASRPKIVLHYTNTLDSIPQIKCTAGGTGIVLSAGEQDRTAKTYTWEIAGGAATPGENIEFSITYDFQGRKYTNKAYSYVEGIAQPAGAFVQTKNKDRKNFLHDYRYVGVSAAIRVLGVGVYSSLDTYSLQDGNTRGYFRAATNSFVENADSAYSTYGYVKTGDGQSTFNINNYKSYADIYIDESVTQTLQDINLRMTIDMPSISASNSSQTLTAVAATEGNQNASTNAASNMNGILGFNSPSSVAMTANTSSQLINFLGENYKMNDTYTIVSKFVSIAGNDSDNWYNYTNIPVVLRFHYVDKSSLRTLINEILYDRDPESTGTNVANKGINPQSWYYLSGGWSGFSTALSDAYKVLNNPRATQDDITTAINSLESAYGNLVLKTADYSVIDEAVPNAEAALERTDWYTSESLAVLQAAIAPVENDFSVIYQAQVDEWANNINNAINNLVVQRANYTQVDAAIADAEELRLNIGYYNDFSAVAAAVATAQAHYNLTKADQAAVDGYASAINNAIAALTYKIADYSAVDLAVSRAKSLTASNYVSFSAVRTTVNNVKYNFPITRQTDVDKMATDINNAIAALVPKPADYSALITLRNQALALNPDYYPAANFQPVLNALAASANYETVDILHQQTITTYTTNLQTAINNLQKYDADYTAVDAAIALAESFSESDLKLRTEDSVQALTNALSAVVRGLEIDEQARVDGFAENIHNAINNLNYIAADYTNVNNAITNANNAFQMQQENPNYYADMSELIAAVNAVDYTLGINKQTEVDEMAANIETAITHLQPGPADYTGVIEALEMYEPIKQNAQFYTPESIQAIETVKNGVNWSLSRAKQNTVDGYTINLLKAIMAVQEAAAYTNELITIMANVPEHMELYYTTASIKVVTDLLSDIQTKGILNLKARNQETVDDYARRLQSAIDNLVWLPGNYSDVNRAIAEGEAIITANNPPISAKSVADFRAYYSSIKTDYNISEADQIAQLAASIRTRYRNFTYAESYYNADLSLNVSNTILCPGQTVTVSVVLNTDYYVASTAIPILYDSTYFEVTSGTQPTFSGTYTQGSITNSILTSPDKGYPSSYTSDMKTKWKYVYVTMIPDSSKSGNAQMLNPGQTVVTFTLTVKNVDIALGSSESGKIWVDPAFLKTESNMGGKLFVGRFPSNVVGLDVYSYGQTIDVEDANRSLTLVNADSPADFTALEAAIADVPEYQQSFYTEDSYQAYAAAFAAALAINNDRDSYTIFHQDAIDAAAQALVEAKGALVLKDATTDPLDQALLLTPVLDSEFYTAETYQVYITAKNAGQAILDEGNLTIVDNDRISASAQTITDAFNALVIKSFSYYDEANEALALQVNATLQYVQDTVDAFNTAHSNLATFMTQTLDIRNDADGLTLINAVNDAYAGLRLVAADIEDLETAVALMNNLPYPQDYYTEDTYSVFAAKVADGTAILERTNLSYLDNEEIAAAASAINAAYSSLQLKDCSYIVELFDLYSIQPTYTQDKYIESYYSAYLAKVDEMNELLNTTLTIADDQRVLDFIASFNATYQALETDGLVEADYTAVDAAITAANAFNPAYYANWNLVADAMSAVVPGLKFTRQAEVDAMAKAINDAIADLVFKDPDFTALQNAINTPLSYDTSFYTEGTYSAYLTALNAANEINNNRGNYTIENQAQIDTTTQVLLDAINALVLNPATTQPLDDAVNAALTLDSSLYTSESYQVLLTALSAGIDLLSETNLTVVDNDRINAAAQGITGAIEALVYKPFSYFAEAQAALDLALDPELEYDETLAAAFTAAHDALATFMEGNLDIRNDAEGFAKIKAVNDAYNALTLKAADTAALEAAVALEPPQQTDYYTDETLASFNGAVDVGKAILAETGLTYQDQARIDAAAQAIVDAFNALILKGADYTAVDTALGNVPEDLSIYSDETAQAVRDAVAAVVTGYDITRQAEVDAMAATVNTALANLEVLANYTDVDTALASVPSNLANYTDETAQSVTDAVAAVIRGLGVSKQDQVDGYATAINTAVEALVLKAANTVDLEAAVATELSNPTDYYTEDTLNAFNDAVAAGEAILAETGLTILDQTRIDDATSAINTAFGALTLKAANTTDLEAAVALKPEYIEEYYIEETLNAFKAAVAVGEAILEETGLTIVDQDRINAATQAILDAHDGLVLKDADYTAVDTALGNVPEDLSIYTDETAQAVRDAVAAVVTGYDITRQAEVDAMAATVNTALANLEVLANYTDVDTALARVPSNLANYTDETAQPVTDAVAAVIRGLGVSKQDQVDGYATAINTAVEALVLKAADYTAVDTAINNANTKLADMQATGDALIEETVIALQNAIGAVERGYNITRQADVDAMAQAINDTAAALAYVPKFEIANPDINVDENGLLTGLKSSTSEADITACFKLVGDRKLEITPVQYDGTNSGYGTGTVVKVVDNAGTVYETYTIVISGDYTGDGVCDAFDQTALTDLINECSDAATTAQMKAVDISADEYLDAFDLALVISMVNMEYYI